MSDVKDKHHLFEDHVIRIIHESEHVKHYEFRNPKDSEFWFYLTCADSLIVMHGDAYTLVIEPGYGRDGLAFMRGSVFSEGYFLGKSPFREELREYSRKRALENFKDYLDSEYITQEQYEEALEEFTDEGDIRDTVSYYDICSDLEIDEPTPITELKNITKVQLAGLQMFVKAYEKMDAEFKSIYLGKFEPIEIK